jgi:thiamine kinase-like enzyme
MQPRREDHQTLKTLAIWRHDRDVEEDEGGIQNQRWVGPGPLPSSSRLKARSRWIQRSQVLHCSGPLFPTPKSELHQSKGVLPQDLGG